MNHVRRPAFVGLLAFLLCALALTVSAGVAPASPYYQSLSFVDRSHGWAAGIDDGYSTVVWRTADGGKTWVPVASRIAAGGGIGWVAFLSADTGVWGYGTLERTVDAGDVWNPATAAGGNYNDAAFATASRGWAGWSWGSSEAGGGIARTDDGGASWVAQLNKPMRDGSGGFSRVSAPTGKRCYVLKWGRLGGVYATADAGTKWSLRSLPAFAKKYRNYYDLDFPAARAGWAVGDSGRIVRTGNAGAGWRVQASGCTARLNAVDFVDTSVGYVVGAGGRLLKTMDGGRHWKRLVTGTSKELRAVCFVDRTHGWVAGSNGALLRTTNGGKTWLGRH